MRNINGKKRGKRINERFYGFHFAFLFRETSSITEGSRHTSYLRYFDLDIRSDRARDINRELAG